MLTDRQVRPQGQVLEHEAQAALVWWHEIPTRRGEAGAVGSNCPGVWHFETRNQAQERRLSTPTRAQNHDRVPGRYVERHVRERLVSPQPLRHVRDADGGHAHDASRRARMAPSTARGPRMMLA